MSAAGLRRIKFYIFFRTPLKIQNPKSDKARENFSAPHMFDMQALKFSEQRSITTEFGFLEVALITI